MRLYARELVQSEKGKVESLHALLAALREQYEWQRTDGTQVKTALDIFKERAGSAEALAHLFIALARTLDIPARFIHGYHLPRNANEPDAEVHCWVEAHVGGLGWVGFDPAYGICPVEAHVRIACGLDGLSAAPRRMSQTGTTTETIESKISVLPSRTAVRL
jgi:transglutaminase-like putative cysteine protease